MPVIVVVVVTENSIFNVWIEPMDHMMGVAGCEITYLLADDPVLKYELDEDFENNEFRNDEESW